MTTATKMNEFERFVDWAKSLNITDREAFDLAADLLGHFGIESCSCGGASMEYLNQGDTYDCTLVLDDQDGLIVCSWGSWYENAENEHCEEYNVVRCGYCGEFTDCAEEWSETICDSCGNCVAG